MAGEKGRSPANSGDGTDQKKTRRCRVLFVLGADVDPSSRKDDLAERFRNSKSRDPLDFSATEIISGAMPAWKAGDTDDLRGNVTLIVAEWCRGARIELDERRILIRDYSDDSGDRYAVAGYFPKETGQDQQQFILSLLDKVVALIREIPPKKLAVIGSCIALFALLALFGPGLIPDGADSDDATANSESNSYGADSAGGAKDTVGNTVRLAAVKFTTGVVRVYTPEPGFGVLIDGEPVRDAAGEIVGTPCAVTTRQGNRTVSLFREGYFDLSKQIDVQADSEVVLTPSEDTAQAGSDYLGAPHRDVPVGEPIALKSLNSSRSELDPYVTPDGLSLWFVGDRAEGRGIFVATRPSIWHDFEAPVVARTSSDLPASPSVTADALSLVYSVPEKARLLSFTKSNPLGEFDDSEPLMHHDSLAPRWHSAQILGDGLRIYWSETHKGKRKTLAAKRPSKFQPFEKQFPVTLPGHHPCMTQDGLRQYELIDGKLNRYRRLSVTKKFVHDATIAELELDGFVDSSKHRQFCVSWDEQWMFYCDDPEAGGDLHMVRLSRGPQWGIAPRGESIPPKAEVAMNDEPEPKPEPDEPPEEKPKPVDPRSLPLPYTAHRTVFNQLLGTRQYDAADGLLVNANSNPAIAPFAKQLSWDLDDLTSIRGFWKDIEQALAEVKVGEQLRLGTRRLEFVEFKNGELVGKRGDTEVRKKISELDPNELSSIHDSKFEKGDVDAQYRIAVFLAYDAQALTRARDIRMERSGVLAEKFKDQAVRRRIVQATAELKRSNFSKGIAFLKEARELADGLPVLAEVESLEEELYGYIKWNRRGPRQWVIKGNEFTAVPQRSNGSLMLSENQYENFELSLEWQTVDQTTAQGGVYFRYTGGGLLIDNAFKIHLANDFGIAPDAYSTGALFGDTPPDENAVKKSGEWNTLLLTVRDGDVTVVVNERKVLEAPAVNAEIPQKGYVALDGVNGGISYRKILLSELPDTK